MPDPQLYPRPCSLCLLQGGGGKVPQPSKKAKQAEAMQIALLKKQLKQSEKPMEMPEFAMPQVPAPAPPPPPPPSTTSADVTNAEQETRRQAGKRKGIQSTLLATAGPNPNALGGQASLLG